MRKLTKILMACVLSLVMIISLAGCGGDAEFDSSTFTIGSSTTVDTLSPLTSYEQFAYEVFLLVYDPLVRYTEDQEPEASLAKEWKLSKDQLTWTFHLQEGAKWHDGKPVTSKDVKYTYELMQKTGLGYMYSSYLENIVDITCPDDNTVVIKTDKSKANMLMNTTPILPQHILSKVSEAELETWANDEMIGSGPYKFASYKNGVIKVTQNPDYFGTKPAVENFVFVEYKNVDSMAQALKLGEIDGAVNISSTQYSQLKDDENIEIVGGQVPGFMQVGINTLEDAKSKGNPLLKDKTIRQALEYAMDKSQIIEMAYGGFAEVGTTLVNPNDPYHYEPTKDELRSFDVNKAGQLLDKAGYKDTDGDGIRDDGKGNKLSFEFINIADNVDEVKTGQLIKSSCEKAGIEIVLKTMDSGALQDTISAADYDMFMWGWGADYDPTTILALLTTAQIGSNNEPGWSNAEYDRLFKEQQNEMDEAKRTKMVQRMQQIAYDEAPYIILMYDNNIQAFRSDRWEGCKQIPDGATYFYNLTYLNYMSLKPLA